MGGLNTLQVLESTYVKAIAKESEGLSVLMDK